MDDLIMKIIDIEERAQEIIKDAKEADKNLAKSVLEKTEQLHKDIEKKAQLKGETVKNIEDSSAEEKIKKIRVDTEKGIADLEKKYRENKTEWVNNIVSSIIG